MILLAIASALTLGAACALLLGSRRVEEERSVRLRATQDQAWDSIRHFAALHAAHHRGGPGLSIQDSSLRGGDGSGPGSLWRQSGRWSGKSYWAEIEIVESDPPRRLRVRLVRDSLHTHRGLAHHCGELLLEPTAPGITRLTWRLSSRLRAGRLVVERWLRPERLQARLLDVGLRSMKVTIEGGALEGAEGPPDVPVTSRRGQPGSPRERL